MKISKDYLKKLIKEELNNVLGESEISKKRVGQNIQGMLAMIKDSSLKEKGEKELIRMYAVENDPIEVAKRAIEVLEPLESEVTNPVYFQTYMKGLKGFVGV